MARIHKISPDIQDAAVTNGQSAPLSLAAYLGEFVWNKPIWRLDSHRPAFFRLTKFYATCKEGDVFTLGQDDYDKLLAEVRGIELPRGAPLKVQIGVMQFLDDLVNAKEASESILQAPPNGAMNASL